jgi:hypothetical protein
MPILGIIASSISGNLDAGDFESIATYSVGSGGAANVEFTSIPATFTHLQIRGLVKGSAAASGGLLCQANSDTGSNYTRHELGGNGSIAYAYGIASQSAVNLYGNYDNLANNDFPVAFVMDVLDYKDTNKYKTFRILSGMDKNGANYGEVFLKSSVWMSGSAITSLKFYIGGQNLGQYSHFALYGIRSA